MLINTMLFNPLMIRSSSCAMCHCALLYLTIRLLEPVYSELSRNKDIHIPTPLDPSVRHELCVCTRILQTVELLLLWLPPCTVTVILFIVFSWQRLAEALALRWTGLRPWNTRNMPTVPWPMRIGRRPLNIYRKPWTSSPPATNELFSDVALAHSFYLWF